MVASKAMNKVFAGLAVSAAVTQGLRMEQEDTLATLAELTKSGTKDEMWPEVQARIRSAIGFGEGESLVGLQLEDVKNKNAKQCLTKFVVDVKKSGGAATFVQAMEEQDKKENKECAPIPVELVRCLAKAMGDIESVESVE